MSARFPIKSGLLQSNLDAGGFQITNLDTSNITGLNNVMMPGEIWISYRSDGGAGNGTVGNPYDGSTTAKLDAILADNTKAPAHTVINLDSCGSTFTTKGSLAWVPKTGWKFILTEGTTIQLAVLSAGDISGLTSDHIVGIFGAGGSLLQDVLVEGGIWDLNMQNQTQTLCPSAIQVFCNGFTARNMKVINFATTTAAEEFVVGVFANGSRDSVVHSRGTLFENIEITQPAAAVTNAGTVTLLNPCGGENITSITALSNGWFEGVTVRNCFFHDIHVTTNIGIDCINIGGAVKGFHSHGNRFYNIYGLAARYAYYWDTGPGLEIKIENDQFYNVSSPAYITNAANPAPVRKNITISNLMIVLNGTVSAIRLEDIAGTGTAEVTISGVTVMEPNGSGGVSATNVAGLRLYNNTIDAGSGEINLTTCTSVARLNNRRPDGTAVTGETAPATGLFAASGVNADITTLHGLGDGTVGAPTLGFNGSVTTGLYRSGGSVLVASGGAAGTAFNYDTSSQVKVRGNGTIGFSSANDLTSAVGPQWYQGAGSPEGAVAAPIGSLYSRNNGSAGTSFYRKESGTGNTGWVSDSSLVAAGSGTVTTVSVVSANNFTGSVANATTTPAITLTYTPPTAYARLVAATTAIVSSSNAYTINWNTTTSWTHTLTENVVYAFSNDTDGWDIVVTILNSGSNYTVAWPSGIKWQGGTAPTMTIGAKYDVYTFIKQGSVISGAVVANLS